MKISYSKNSFPIRAVYSALIAGTIGMAGVASAQPRMGQGGQRMDRDAMMSKRMIAAIEEKTGKSLTEAQKKKLQAAIKTRAAANKAANDKFMAQVAGITGLKASDLRGMGRGGGRGMGGPGGNRQ